MFTCPNKDIHSIYIDGELPVEYKVKYEAHVNSCQKCQAELKKLKKLHEILQSDSFSLNDGWDKNRLDSSYEKLQSRLAFHKITSFAQEENKSSNILKFTIPLAAAAAAVFALVIPLRIQHIQSEEIQKSESSITPLVSKATVSEQPIAENNILVSGNISSESLEKMAEHNEQKQQRAPSETISSYTDVLSSTVHYLGNATNVANQQVMRVRKALAAIDVFQPEFDDAQAARISITIPTAANIPVQIENLEQTGK